MISRKRKDAMRLAKIGPGRRDANQSIPDQCLSKMVQMARSSALKHF